ncbi:MAG: hypothetical protein IJQ08_08335 [Synergistaceae bacterium]|nr:hypothetical protein [Synergistaceae bacterium]MBR0186213.1 hypothetical protein [Synergistaceae bacterium]
MGQKSASEDGRIDKSESKPGDKSGKRDKLEEKLLKEIDTLKAELEKAQKTANENAQYRAFVENRVNKKAKDSVFINLFTYPEYQMWLYEELFPEDKTITPAELVLFKVDHILINHPYNDLGLLVRGKLIVLAEAQTKWSENIIYRLAEYYFQSMEEFIYKTKMNVHSTAKIDMLDVEAFVIYPGTEKIENDVISLRDVFFNGYPSKPDFKARIIHGDYSGGIISEYMNFCRVYDEQREIHKNDMDPKKGIAKTVEICIEKGFLRKYLEENRAEVERIMFDMYNPEYVKEMEQLSRIYETEISFGRDAGMPDAKIKEVLIRRHGVTPTYAQNLLDDKPSTSTVMAL